MVRALLLLITCAACLAAQDVNGAIGAAREAETDVAGSVEQVQTESSEQGRLITGEQITELQLNGRSFMTLLELVPGVASNIPDRSDPNTSASLSTRSTPTPRELSASPPGSPRTLSPTCCSGCPKVTARWRRWFTPTRASPCSRPMCRTTSAPPTA